MSLKEEKERAENEAELGRRPAEKPSLNLGGSWSYAFL